jgi:hypothetical protein
VHCFTCIVPFSKNTVHFKKNTVPFFRCCFFVYFTCANGQ